MVKTNIKITSSFNSIYLHYTFKDDESSVKAINVGKKINLLPPIPSALQPLLAEPVAFEVLPIGP